MGISRSWGRFDAYPSRHGMNRCRLVVFPPDLTARQRLLLRLWRGWPLWGAVLWLAVQAVAVLSGITSKAAALIGGSLLYIAGGAMTFALAHDICQRVRTVWGMQMTSPHCPALTARYANVLAWARTLDRADRELCDGRICPSEHEARCWTVYTDVGGVRPLEASQAVGESLPLADQRDRVRPAQLARRGLWDGARA